MAVPPRVSPFVFDEGLQEGMRTQVMCTTIAGDEPINMTWLKDSKEVQPLPSTSTNSNSKGTNHGIHVNYFSTFSTILTIPNITALHSGNYSCVVENLVGKVGHEAQLIVTGGWSVRRQIVEITLDNPVFGEFFEISIWKMNS